MIDPSWKQAMDEEIQVLQRNHTWDLTELLAGKKVVGWRQMEHWTGSKLGL